VEPVRLSKLLSRVLRHEPGRFGIQLDRAGWVCVADLIEALNKAGRLVTREDIEAVVRTSDKQRFAIDADTDRIRANQGHSVAIDLGLPHAMPPALLYHGTPLRNLDAILREGLIKRSRHAVHLSPDIATAHVVGARRGRHVVLAVAAAAMYEAGHQFTCSANGVWLVDSVPPRFLTQLDDD
jgi:putative RNA 2'-phosphotransferase